MSSTQSISGGVLPWEVPTQKTAGNPHSCCWGKWRVGRKQRSCTYGMFSTNFKCGQITVLSKYDSSSWKMRKTTVAKGQMHCEKYDKSEEKPQGQCSNLFNLSSHCRRSYKTFSAVPWLFDCSYFVLCYFMLTPRKCCARNSQCKESWYQVFFRMTTSLRISISLITQHSHSCFLRMKLLLCTCTWWREMLSSRIAVCHFTEVWKLIWHIGSNSPLQPLHQKNTTLLDEYDVKCLHAFVLWH